MSRDDSLCRVIPTPAPYLEYHFYVRSDDDFDIWVRAAAMYPNSRMRMELRPVGQEPYSETFEIFSSDIEEFKDIVWELQYLEENEYYLRLYLNNWQTVCSVAVKDSTSRHIVHVPGTYPATFYADASDSTKEIHGNCPYENYKFSGVDSLIVQDPECVSAISEQEVACAVGWTAVDEKLTYRFKTDGVQQYVNLSFRISSHSKNRRMKVELFSAEPYEFIIEAPGKGWNEYETVVLENLYVDSIMYHAIYVTFLDGQMNLCSFGVEYAE